ncbi:S8 family serine peptidase [Algiphilus sp. W345]|uniref:S8 family serine peptidase n=1 Tax=Banduia mediterranea TaxID=3075609 RepID=A0ABU2WHI2_9GAMM|nr:S8 family serine peptidase [Algiphilus sp. W345]MDT0497331.1 S8 family serine peptidase [Algiphilus sp. W345]
MRRTHRHRRRTDDGAGRGQQLLGLCGSLRTAAAANVNEATKAAGIVQVVYAGNDGDTCGTLAFPLAVYESSFTVGATDNNDEMAYFSSRSPVLTDPSLRIKPDVVAPGVNKASDPGMCAPHSS